MASSSENRPDPDALLAKVQRQEAAARRGKLRIYFGSSAGVGKTYAMLLAARKLKSEGRDVVVGIVETHGRAETASLLEDMEVLPLKLMPYRGKELVEFDLDAALHRHPELILVDELAHSNVQGQRHPKRWQDVEELLGAGIDVFTTLNVQHLESLNDVVGGITNVRVWETIPDTVFDAADEVVLVDIPADELLARLKAGKVYVPQQAERAASNFFRKGNLMALRELALRRTADRIEGDVQAYRVDKSIASVWKTASALLTCVGPDAGAERVVRAAARLASQLNADWHAIYVETPSLQRLPCAEAREHSGDAQSRAGARRDHGGDRQRAGRRERDWLRAQPQFVQSSSLAAIRRGAFGPGSARAARNSRCWRRTSIWWRSAGPPGRDRARARQRRARRVSQRKPAIGAGASVCDTCGRRSSALP